jgi:hypothetical protein
MRWLLLEQLVKHRDSVWGIEGVVDVTDKLKAAEVLI